MCKLFEYANEYVKESDWKDLALLKFCLFAMGLLVGMKVAPRHKKAVTITAIMVFIATYIPLMSKFVKIAADGRKEGR